LVTRFVQNGPGKVRLIGLFKAMLNGLNKVLIMLKSLMTSTIAPKIISRALIAVAISFLIVFKVLEKS
jgi:hypothetical protein